MHHGAHHSTGARFTVNSAIRIVTDEAELHSVAAEEFIRITDETIASASSCFIALSGGSTPRGLYRLLAQRSAASQHTLIAWNRIQFFWGDERNVPPDHADSNYRMAAEALFSRVPVPTENVHRIPTDGLDAGRAAWEYERALYSAFGLAGGELPSFDLVLLGLGSDAHTASLFPESAALRESVRLVVAQQVEKLATTRVTLTPPVLNNAKNIVFVVSGADKAEAVRRVFEGKYQPELVPAQVIRPSTGRLLWLMDRAASAKLTAY
jgi:6-phosphogluconolactonase